MTTCKPNNSTFAEFLREPVTCRSECEGTRSGPNATEVVRINSEVIKSIMDTTLRLSSYLFGMGENKEDVPKVPDPSCFMEELNDQMLLLKITRTELENICSRLGL